MNDMKWTDEWPTEPGYYWVRKLSFKHRPDGPEVEVEDTVIVDACPDELYFTGDEVGIARSRVRTAEWCGPLQPPDDIVLCDFSYLTEDHPATTKHIDYDVCDEHLELAVENVHGRTMPN